MVRRTIMLTTILVTAWLSTTGVQATTIAYLPLLQVTDRTDLWVRATLHDIHFRPIPEDERHRFGMEGLVELTATLRIIESAPALTPKEIALHWATVEGQQQRIASTGEVIVALKRRADGTYASLYATGRHGWLPVNTQSGTIANLPELGGTAPAELVWELVRDLRNALDAPEPDPAMAARWKERISTSNPRAFAAACVIFDAFPAFAPEPSDFVRAMQRNRADFVVLPALRVLQRIATPDAVHALLTSYEQDLAAGSSTFDNQETEVREAIARLVAERGGPERVSILKDLLVRRVDVHSASGLRTGERRLLEAESSIFRVLTALPGEDIDALLLEMLEDPEAFEIPSVLDLAMLWQGLAERGTPEIVPYLRAFLENPDTTTLGVPAGRRDNRAVMYAQGALAIAAKQQSHKQYLETLFWLYENGDKLRLERLLLEIQPGDDAFLPKLSSLSTKDLLASGWAPRFCQMAETLANPAFLPQLQAIAKADESGDVVGALFACGDEEAAFALAQRILEKKPSKEWRTLYNEINEMTRVLSALGEHGDSTVTPLVERYTRAEVISDLDKALRNAARREGTEYYDFPLRQLRRAAILALVPSGGTTTIPRLQELYAEEDIAVRIAAAMALHALGDNTGDELVRLFAEHREMEHEEIRARWRIDLGGGGGGFHYAVSNLKSPHVDALFLERLQRGFGPGDEAIAGRPDLVAKNEALVLQALLNGLEHKDPTIRAHAHRNLLRVTNQDFDYDPERPVKTQVAALQKWKTWLANRESSTQAH